jgi:hypothetical protein
MQKANRIPILLLLALVLGSCAKGNGTVKGLVVESQRQFAVEGAFVHIQSLEGDKSEQFVYTDINGLYEFDNVIEGLNRVTVIKEGFGTNPATCSGCRKFADVTESQTLTLDFSIDLVVRSVSQKTLVRILDDRGPLAGATVDLYRGPCVGRSLTCLHTLPNPIDYTFFAFESFTTAQDGTISVPFASDSFPVDELSTWYYQLRVTAPDHQNRVFDLSFNINSIPATLDFVLPRL